MRRLIENVKIVNHFSPKSRTAAANGVGVDTAGWDGLLVVLSVGAVEVDGNLQAVLQQADNNVSFANLTGALFGTVYDDGNDKVYTLDVRLGERANRRRWVRIRAIPTGAIFFGIVCILYQGEAPALDPQLLGLRAEEGDERVIVTTITNELGWTSPGDE